ncbi:hypothetical protein G6O69_19900 [Pseudenhygromyxa sp. WMMC2535]|uniref:hypothetical protein n=1 Tax=Pseudenhygromyxa sp. WMMC2535 TaxID=2712867 RepID=UPI001552087E|nr:hypothetical protein [Pseudenhygromyxa sp. WMMC2535]NVB40120.1 hypothetical protein [Pseudenhygromyxa sp. WMMC2535]
MNISRNLLISCLLAFSPSLLIGCDKDKEPAVEEPADKGANEDKKVEVEVEVEEDKTPEPEPAGDEGDGPDNLCKKYASCNACIAGEQDDGKTEGEAETVCALAVTGCWTTWDKPVVCGEKQYDEKPE